MPNLAGYTIARDAVRGTWVVRSNWADGNGRPPIVLKGRRQEELIAARHRYYAEALAELREVIASHRRTP